MRPAQAQDAAVAWLGVRGVPQHISSSDICMRPVRWLAEQRDELWSQRPWPRPSSPHVCVLVLHKRDCFVRCAVSRPVPMGPRGRRLSSEIGASSHVKPQQASVVNGPEHHQSWHMCQVHEFHGHKHEKVSPVRLRVTSQMLQACITDTACSTEADTSGKTDVCRHLKPHAYRSPRSVSIFTLSEESSKSERGYTCTNTVKQSLPNQQHVMPHISALAQLVRSATHPGASPRDRYVYGTPPDARPGE